MKISIETTERARRPKFSVARDDDDGFALHSFLIVDRGGQPMWEFVSEKFEPTEMEIETEVWVVMTDEFRELLQSTSIADVAASESKSRVHNITYGAVPPSFKQSIPEGVMAPELTPGDYRAVIFSSAGSASVAFRVED